MLTPLLTLLTVLIAVFIYRHCKKYSNLPPGPWNLPILGSLHLIDPKNPYLSLTTLSKKYGKIYGLKLGFVYTVVISDVKLLKKILIKEAASGRPPLHVFETLLQRKGIAYRDGKLWKSQQKLVVNFLREAGASKNSSNRGTLESKILESARDLVDHMASRGEKLNLAEAVAHNVGNISSFLFLGKFWHRDDEVGKLLSRVIDNICKNMAVAGPLNFLPFLQHLPMYKKVLCNLKEEMHKMFDVFDKQIVAENQQKIPNNHQSIPNLIKVFLGRKNVSEEISTDTELRFLIRDMFGASFETTSNTTLWTIYYLAKHEEIQNKLRQELYRKYEKRSPSVTDLSDLAFLEATLAEVSRIRTVLPLGFPHYALEDIEIEDYKIPKGSNITGLLWAIHMDPNVWRDPEEFRPERFLNEDGKFHKPEAFIPFETGMRMCPGEELSKMVIFQFVTVILQNFQITCKNGESVDLEGTCGLSLIPKRQNLIFTKI